MRLKPPVSEQEALQWLMQQATATWGTDKKDELEKMLKPIAEAMAAVSAAEVPEEVEPSWP